MNLTPQLEEQITRRTEAKFCFAVRKFIVRFDQSIGNQFSKEEIHDVVFDKTTYTICGCKLDSLQVIVERGNALIRKDMHNSEFKASNERWAFYEKRGERTHVALTMLQNAPCKDTCIWKT